MKICKKINGITLISLIITIVIMLILAAVAISLVIGKNGLFKKTNDSVSVYSAKKAEEAIELVLAEKDLDEESQNETWKEFLDSRVPEELDKVTGEGPFDVEKDGYTITVSVEGKITDVIKSDLVSQVSDLQIGSYVKYDVGYYDIHTYYNFSKDNGWRILDPGTKNADGTYNGVKIISTGIPAELYYHLGNITSATWAGKEDQMKDYRQKFYGTTSNSDESMIAATGLYYNFGKIKFEHGLSTTTYNIGQYESINGKTSGILEITDFLKDNAKEVHNLTLYELNQARNRRVGTKEFELNLPDGDSSKSPITAENDGGDGLFYLRNLNKYQYNNSTDSCYWLASPNSSSFLWYVTADGQFMSVNSCVIGVRPVITLKDHASIEIK